MKRILLIEDNDLFRRYLASELTGAGFKVDDFANGREGLVSFQQTKPDIVITDLVMDDGEGIGTILTIRKQAKTVPIIAISGHGEYLDNSAKLGADKTLLKPFKLDQLVDCINPLLP